MLHLHLRRHRRNPPLLQYAVLGRQRSRHNAAAPAVIAHPVADPPADRHIVYHHGVDVHIADPVRVHAIDRRVVEEVAAVPVAAVVAMPDVSVPVIHAAIVSDVQPPVTVVEAIEPAIEAPVAGSPQSALIRRIHPATGNPVVSLRPPRPVSRSPQVVGVRRGRLVVLRQRRRRIAGLRIGQIVCVVVGRLLIAELAVVSAIVIALLAPTRVLAHDGRGLLRIVLTLLLVLFLRTLPQHLRRLPRAVPSTSHIRIRRVAAVLVDRALRTGLRRLMAARGSQHQRHPQAGAKKTLPKPGQSTPPPLALRRSSPRSVFLRLFDHAVRCSRPVALVHRLLRFCLRSVSAPSGNLSNGHQQLACASCLLGMMHSVAQGHPARSNDLRRGILHRLARPAVGHR